VLSEIGGFGGLYRPDLAGLAEPVLVASADGVGTKLALARMAGDFSTVGRDLVNHCVNDILVQGARPLFFLDYVGAGVLEPAKMVELVGGVAAACADNGCALLGGETAEMPGFYQPGDYELVGFIVGLVDRAAILDGSRVEPRDVLVGLPSAGLHTNGYSLARRILAASGLSLDQPLPGGGGESLGDALLAPHRWYGRALLPELERGGAGGPAPRVHALAHVTGGGIAGNLARVLPSGARVRIDPGAWPRPPLFEWLTRAGQVPEDDARTAFNLGIGMVAVAPPDAAETLSADLERAGERVHAIGRVVAGERGVEWREE
jgi:phosphoribosylformylglycinamidine cyclo-ligase